MDGGVWVCVDQNCFHQCFTYIMVMGVQYLFLESGRYKIMHQMYDMIFRPSLYTASEPTEPSDYYFLAHLSYAQDEL